MSGLRDQTAAAIREHRARVTFKPAGYQTCECGFCFKHLHDYEAHLADAVLALLTEEWGAQEPPGGVFGAWHKTQASAESHCETTFRDAEPKEPDPHPVRRWGEEHSAKTAPVGIVLYDDDDDLFTVKTGPNEWTTYYRTYPVYQGPLVNRDIDGDRGDQIVGHLESPGRPVVGTHE